MNAVTFKHLSHPRTPHVLDSAQCLEHPPVLADSFARPTSLDALRAKVRRDRGPLKDGIVAHMNIIAGGLDGAFGIKAGAMFGYEAEYANARTAARIESAIVGVFSGIGMARTAGVGLQALQGGAAAAVRPASVVTAAAGAAVATGGLAKLNQPLESRSVRRDPLGSVQAAVDSTGKAHKDLPKLSTLKSLPSDELRALKTELEVSVTQRIRMTAEKGSDYGHAARQWREQSIIKLIDKILADRRQ